MKDNKLNTGTNPPGPDMRLLIVDGSSSNPGFQILLREEGYKVQVAHNGREALTLLEKEHFDGVISPCFVSDMDGFELCRTVRGRWGIPFIMFSNKKDEGEESLAKKAGASLFVHSEGILPDIQEALENPEPVEIDETAYLQEYTTYLKRTLDQLSRKMEEIQGELSRSEMKYQKLFEGAHDATFIMNAEGAHIEANRKASELLGYTLEEFRKLSFRNIVVPPALSDSEKKLKQLLKGEDIPIYEKVFKAKDGRLIPVEISVSGIQDESGKVVYIQSIVRDISERKKAEELLSKSEREYKNLFENAPVGIYRTTPDGRILKANPALVHMLGYSSFEELTQRNLEEGAYEAGYPRSYFKEWLERDGKITGLESQWKRKDGTVLFFRENAKVVRDEAGSVLYYEGTTEDITKRREAEKELQRSEGRFRALVQNSSDIVYVLDSEGVIQYASPNVQHILGYSENVLDENVSVLDFVHPEDLQRAKTALFELKETFNQTMVYEFRIRTRQGVYLWMEVWGKNLLDDPAVSGIVLNIRNITERRQALEDLRESEEKYRNIVELAPDGIMTVSLKGTITSCNSAFLDLTGFSRDEIVGAHFTKLPTMRARDIPQYVRLFSSLIRGKEVGPLEFTWVHKNGSHRLGEARISLVKRRKTVIGIQAFARDITERKQALEDLRESEEKYRNIVELAPDGIVTVSLKGVVTSCNSTFLSLSGYSSEEIIGKHFTALPSLLVKDIPTYMKVLNSLVRGKVPKPFEVTWVRKDGSIHVGEIHICLMKRGRKTVGLQTIVRDITERKQIEEKLRLSEEKYRTLVQNLNVGIYRTTPGEKGTFVDVNPAFSRMLGYERDELLKMKVSDIYIDSKGRERFNNKILSKGFVKNEELSLKRKDGTEIIVSDTATVISDADGGVMYFDGISEDITQRKKVEQELETYRQHLEELVEGRTRELKETNERLQKEILERIVAEESLAGEKERLAVTLRSIGDGVITTDTEGRIILMNRMAEQLTGWTQEEALGKPLNQAFKIISEKTRKPCESPVEKVLQHGTVEGLGNDTVLLSRDGTERIIADSGSPIRDKASKIIGVVLVFRDVTEKRKMEQELFRTQKLESVGILAGGIAHDFNNILTAILDNVVLAKAYTSESRVMDKLASIEKASLQARNLTHQLLTFSRGGVPIRRITSIAQLVKDSAVFALRGSNVGCQFSIAEDLWPVEVDEGQIHQVINNLIINAEQAMPEGGMVKVTAENVVVDRDGTLARGKYVKISIADEGIGIPEKYFSKIFDPYFTTKQRGSGLGLATSYSIIKKHNGHIDLESEVGVGSTFFIFLPASGEEVEKEEEIPGRVVEGEGRILFMDDESIIREAAGEVLQYLGYRVEFAKDGKEVIAFYKEAMKSGKPFDVVIMDLTIPGGMGGEETLRELKKVDPYVRAIVSSGYSNDPIMADYRSHGFKGVVTKPYTLAELSETLREVMEE